MRHLIERRARVSPAFVVAVIALFVALSGAAVATTTGMISGLSIKNSSITGADVKDKSLTRRGLPRIRARACRRGGSGRRSGAQGRPRCPWREG